MSANFPAQERHKVAPDENALRIWRFLVGLPPMHEGSIVVGPGGETVRILADGGAEEIRPVPTRRGVLVDLPAAWRRAEPCGRSR